MRAVLFDLDGTVADTARVCARTAQLAIVEVGATPVTEEAARRLVGLPLAEMLGRLAPEADRRALVAAYRGAFDDIARRLARPIAGIEPVLDGLLDRGDRLAIATSKRSDAARFTLELVGLLDRFAFVATEDQVANGKPAPDTALLALERLGVGVEAAVVVGDTSYDIGMARAAGVRAIGVTWGVHDEEVLRDAGAHDVVSEMAGLMRVLGV